MSDHPKDRLIWIKTAKLYITMYKLRMRSIKYILTLYSRRKGREHSGSVVECLTRDRRAAGSSLTGVTALYP